MDENEQLFQLELSAILHSTAVVGEVEETRECVIEKEAVKDVDDDDEALKRNLDRDRFRQCPIAFAKCVFFVLRLVYMTFINDTGME